MAYFRLCCWSSSFSPVEKFKTISTPKNEWEVKYTIICFGLTSKETNTLYYMGVKEVTDCQSYLTMMLHKGQWLLPSRDASAR